MATKQHLIDRTQPPLNHQWQGVDKDLDEEKGKGEKVTNDDLKGKKVDPDPSKIEDQPIE